MIKCGRLSPNITMLNSYIRKISLADLVFSCLSYEFVYTLMLKHETQFLIFAL